MTLVNAETGEIVEIATREEAEALAAEISASVAHANVLNGRCINLMIEANLAKIWVSLGYGSWAEMVEAKNWRWSPLLPEDRAIYGEYFRKHGMTYQSIGAVMGRSAQSVRRDIEGAYASDRLPNGSAPAADPDPLPNGSAVEHIDDETEPIHAGAEAETVEPVPAAPVTEGEGEVPIPSPSPRPLADVEKLTDLASPADQWRLRFDKATRAVLALTESFPADDVVRFADHDQFDTPAMLADRIGRWAEQIRAGRRTGLRSIEGGRS